MNSNFIEDTCELIDKIKEVLKEHKITTFTNYKSGDKFYLVTDFMIIIYSEKDQVVDIAFHIATRSDIASFFTLILTDFDEIKDINIMEVYTRNDKGIVLTGEECIKKHQEDIKNGIIDTFIEEQIQLHCLKTSHVGGVC